MRVWTAIAAGLALSACEFVKLQPVPVPYPLPVPSTVRGSSSGSAGPTPAPTPQQMIAAMGTMSTQEVCGLLADPLHGNDAFSELKQRGDFTDYEIVRIARRYFLNGRFVDFRRVAPAGAGTGSRTRMAGS